MTSARTLLKAWNLRPKKRLGQHFLSDPATAQMLVSHAAISSEDVVLEFGAGLGALTIPAARRAAMLLAVEKDRQLAALLKTELLAHGISNVEIIAENILNLDIQALARRAGRKLIVLGNLPYNISSQVLVQLIHCRPAVQRALLMFQKELAQRLAAPVGKKDYGRLTVMLRYCAEIKKLATVRASLFFPAPKVDSEVLEICFRTQPEYPSHDEAMLFQIIKAAFGNRRKTLKNALAASSLPLDRPAALQALDAAGITPSRRAETLSVAEFIKLQAGLDRFLRS